MAIKVLFVDDSTMVLKTIKIFLKDLLESGEIELEQYSNSTEVYEKLTKNMLEFDIAFVDIYMPDIDGFELTKKLRSIEKYQDKPIIALTTEISVDAKMKGKDVGINGWITKMSSPSMMRDSIQSAVEKFVIRGEL